MSIHKLREELQGLMALSDEVGPEAIQDTIAGMSGEIGDVIEEVVKYIRNMELMEEAAKAEADRIKTRAARFAKSAESARAAIGQVMELAGQTSCSTALFTVALAKGRDSVDVFDSSLLPDEFIEVKVIQTPDKKQIREAIKNGTEVPGAKIVIGNKSLRIK